MPYRSRGERRQPNRRERPLVFTGAICLSAIAGYINVVVLGFFHVPVSHMTGAVSRLSIDVAAGHRSDFLVAGSIVGAFFVGAVLSGAIIGGRKLAPGRRYGVALLTEGTALAISAFLLTQGSRVGVTLAALACGIQNAMASSYFGLILRTTHVTGIVTDLGVLAGHWIRHRRVRPWKPLLLASILLSFFVGGLAGHYMFQSVGVVALTLASAGCLIAGTTYYLWRHYRTGRTTVGILAIVLSMTYARSLRAESSRVPAAVFQETSIVRDSGGVRSVESFRPARQEGDIGRDYILGVHRDELDVETVRLYRLDRRR